MEKHEIAQLETNMKEMRDVLAKLADGKSIEEFITIIHKPGFTTPAEAALIRGLTESMLQQAKSMMSLKQVLLAGVAKVELNPQPLPPKVGRAGTA